MTLTREQVEALASRNGWNGGMPESSLAVQLLATMDALTTAEARIELYRKREEALLVVLRAIRNKGAHPDYHDKVMKKHRREWPVLWNALDALLKADEEATS
jgi:hypothetical protein